MGRRRQRPGPGRLNAGGSAWVDSLSCPGAGICAAGGDFVDSSHHLQPFVANEQSGQWNDAIEVPGIAGQDASAPGHGGQAQAGPVSCAGSGYCVATGYYIDYFDQSQAFVVAHQ